MTLDELQKLCDEAMPGLWTPYRVDKKFGEKDYEFIAALANHASALLAVARAAEITCDAIYKMKEGLIYANSELGRVLHSAPDLRAALAAFRGEK